MSRKIRQKWTQTLQITLSCCNGTRALFAPSAVFPASASGSWCWRLPRLSQFPSRSAWGSGRCPPAFRLPLGPLPNLRWRQCRNFEIYDYASGFWTSYLPLRVLPLVNNASKCTESCFSMAQMAKCVLKVWNKLYGVIFVKVQT